jgi:DNA-binding HxlR family transcriptional regulator
MDMEQNVARRTSVDDAECPVARALDVIGDWWSLLIIRDALDGVTRFNEFQKGLGVSRGILATRLQSLTALGILATAPAADGSAYQRYVLTTKGRDLFPVVVGLRQWGEDYCFAPNEPHSLLVESATGKRVGRLEVKSKNGLTLAASDTTVKKLAALEARRTRQRAPAHASKRVKN